MLSFIKKLDIRSIHLSPKYLPKKNESIYLYKYINIYIYMFIASLLLLFVCKRGRCLNFTEFQLSRGGGVGGGNLGNKQKRE